MRIGLIHQTFKWYGVKRLCEEIKKKNELVKIEPNHAILTLHGAPDMFLKAKKLKDVNVVLPRFGTRHLNFGLTLVRHLEQMGIPCINSATGIWNCKNKYLTSLLLKKKRIPQPKSAIALNSKDMIRYIEKVEKPVVVKLIISSHGIGIARIHDQEEAQEWLDTFEHFHEPIFIQEYIRHQGMDYRLFVVGGEIIGSMKRLAPKGSWKTNYSSGGSVERFNPNSKMKEIAFKAAKACKINIAGVDIVDSQNGPMVLEVNCMPEFKGLEFCTKKNIAKEIVKYAKQVAKK